jgi:hypothetical protein
MEFYASCSDLCSQLMEEKQTGLTKAISVQAIRSGGKPILGQACNIAIVDRKRLGYPENVWRKGGGMLLTELP